MAVSCEQATRWTDAWIDGELDPSAALLVEDHLAACACCRAEADMIRKLKRGLGALREDCAPTALRFRITAALDACDREQEAERAAVARKKHARNFALAGAALASVVLANGARVRTGATPPLSTAGMLPVVEDVAERHARELPVEVSNSDPAAVQQWFRGKMDIPVRPVMFRGMPARLVGARISNVQNQMAAALTYEVDGRRMTVFMFDSARLPHIAETSDVMVHGRPTYTTSAHGYTVTFTEQQGIGYAIASDLPPQECARIVAHAEMR